MGIADVSPSLWGECEEQAGMHFSGEGHVHVELIDPESGDGAPVRGSGRGRARLHVAAPRGDAGAALPLAATAWWSTRSRARAGARALRVRCIGRTDDLLIVRGVNLFPTALREVVAEFGGAARS